LLRCTSANVKTNNNVTGLKAGEDDFECPEPDAAFPHPEFCHLYYWCVGNVSTLETCPPKQLFDLVYKGCNWDYLVDCGDRIPPGGETTENPGEGEFECPEPGGAFPHPEFCDQYYVCVVYEATLKTCPTNQLFDLAYDGCNWDYLVDCGDRIPPTRTEVS